MEFHTKDLKIIEINNNKKFEDTPQPDMIREEAVPFQSRVDVNSEGYRQVHSVPCSRHSASFARTSPEQSYHRAAAAALL